MREASDIIINDIRELMDVTEKQAYKYKDIPMIGRSHGVHAEPMTFGLKFALWYEDMKRNLAKNEEGQGNNKHRETLRSCRHILEYPSGD